MAHGAQKLFAWPVAEPRDPVPLISILGLAGALEVFGGLLLLLGLFTRPLAFVLAGEMAVACFLRHATKGFWPVGPGPWSLDALRNRREGDRRRWSS